MVLGRRYPNRRDFVEIGGWQGKERIAEKAAERVKLLLARGGNGLRRGESVGEKW